MFQSVYYSFSSLFRQNLVWDVMMTRLKTSLDSLSSLGGQWGEHYCQDNCEPWGDHLVTKSRQHPLFDRVSIRFTFNKDYIRVGLIFYGHGIAPCKQEAAAWCRQLSVIVTCLGVSETERGRDWGRRHGAEQAVESEPGAGTQVRQRHLIVTLTIENSKKLIEW